MKRNKRNLITLVTRIAFLGLLSALNFQFSTALAVTQVVTSLNDSGAGTLREAIGAPTVDTITFSLGGTITLTTTPLTIAKNLTIIGPAASLTVSGNHAMTVFGILSGTVNISNLTITQGENVNGGGIYNHGTLTVNDCIVTNNSASSGGAAGIWSDGTLTLNRCRVVYNYAGGDRTNVSGGGILNGGTLTVNNCEISGNSSGNLGGGIYNLGPLTVNNTTFWDNYGQFGGGGIFNGGSLSLVNCTITGNLGPGAGGGLYQYGGSGGTTVIRNTIVSGNTSGNPGADVLGQVASQGHNLVSSFSGSSGWISSDLQVQDPLLAFPPQDNGGGTLTMALLPGSPAIDAGDDAVLGSPYNLTTDQRGRPRRSGVHVDIGAFEVSPAPLVVNNNDAGPGSLREAVLIAGPNEAIYFAPNVVGVITLTSGEIVIAKSRRINGPGAKVLTVSGNNASRILHLTGGASQMYGLRLANGHTTGGGGGIDLEIGTYVSLDRCAIEGCYAQGNELVSAGGGAIAVVNATAVLEDCTLSGNSTPDYGGGIYLYGGVSRASLLNCTISGNRTLGSFSDYGGGGIFSINGSTLDLFNCTIANNSSLTAGGGIWKAFNGTATLHDTLVAGNTAPGGPDCYGSFVSAGHNLIGNSSGSTGFGAIGDQLNKNPQLAPLADYGGPTLTHALFTTSPAVDAGNGSGATDQRGKLRPFDFPSVGNATGNGSDIGAFEVNPPEASIGLVGNQAVISWPFYYVGYTVQATSDPSLSTGWTPVPGTPVLVGDHYTQTVGITTVATWYRLKSS